jgi:DNA-binding NarL/FixJ family response regulator
MATTIVVADDHQLVREGIRMLLETRSDFEVVGEASDGEEAVKIVLDRKPDIAVMDIWMPHLSGIDATREIEKCGLPTKVVMLSMHASRAYVEETLSAGAAGYIVKSAASKELLDAIDAVLAGGSFLSPAVTQEIISSASRSIESPPAGIGALTDREREVLQLVADGQSSKEIASSLGISLKTVDSHRSNLMEKLDIHKVAGLVRFAIRSGIVEP